MDNKSTGFIFDKATSFGSKGGRPTANRNVPMSVFELLSTVPD
ncbi:hypothetical protein [Saccharicrinis sp. FJH54]